ncbi:MAG TPA: alpha/beta hydrolase [Bacilli bacterium]
MDKISFETDNYLELNIAYKEKRPLVLIAPGGGYQWTSPREAQPVQDVFQKAGYQTGIIYYRETKLLYPETLKELASFVTYVRGHAEEYYIDRDFIALVGFSAGAHYVASLGVDWRSFGDASRPDALILAYPVITGKKGIAHEGSVRNLFGKIDGRARRKFSLEKRVSSATPPTFLFHTVSDASVPYQNSLLFFEALKKAGVDAEMHLYQEGPHGIALANRTTPFPGEDPLEFERKNERLSGWIDLAVTWLKEIKK